jgi:hypothetical protein
VSGSAPFADGQSRYGKPQQQNEEDWQPATASPSFFDHTEEKAKRKPVSVGDTTEAVVDTRAGF